MANGSGRNAPIGHLGSSRHDRTADYAALDFSGPRPALVGLEGRSPTRFRTPPGKQFGNIDVTNAFQDLPLPFFALHQNVDGSLILRTRCDDQLRIAAEQGLRDLFGPGQSLAVEIVPEEVPWSGKTIQYTSDS
jgi:hypothetical protein